MMMMMMMMMMIDDDDDDDDDNKKKNVLIVNFLHLFVVYTRLIFTGHNHALELHDLWELNSQDTSAHIVPKFEREWNKELRKAQK